MGKYIPQLEFLGVLLGDQPVLELRERYYQRLLANDVEEAQDVVDEALKESSLLELCDRLVLPALRFIEQDHDRGVIDDARRGALIDQVAAMVEELPADHALSEASGGEAAGAPVAEVRMAVLLLPAADRADEVAALMLAKVLGALDFDTEVPSAATLKGEMLDIVRRRQPHAICVSAAPPAAVVHARYLGKKLHAVAPGTPVVVGLWDAQGDLTKARERLASVGLQMVAIDAATAVRELVQLRLPLLQGVRTQEPEQNPTGDGPTSPVAAFARP
jgi:hypothetical protein